MVHSNRRTAVDRDTRDLLRRDEDASRLVIANPQVRGVQPSELHPWAFTCALGACPWLLSATKALPVPVAPNQLASLANGAAAGMTETWVEKSVAAPQLRSKTMAFISPPGAVDVLTIAFLQGSTAPQAKNARRVRARIGEAKLSPAPGIPFTGCLNRARA